LLFFYHLPIVQLPEFCRNTIIEKFTPTGHQVEGQRKHRTSPAFDYNREAVSGFIRKNALKIRYDYHVAAA
jgi:hypothetical protein